MHRVLAIVFLIVSAGCITLPEDADGATQTPLPPQRDGSMTAKESVEDSGPAPCRDRGISLPNAPVSCITRTTTVAGDMELVSLPVALAASWADITVAAGRDDSWSLRLVVESAAATAEEARAQLDRVTLAWRYEVPQGYALQAEVKTEGNRGVDGVSADLVLVLPPSVVYGLDVVTSSGDIDVGGLQVHTGSIIASSGDVLVTGVRGESLNVQTSSGDSVLRKLAVRAVSVGASSGDLDIEAEGATLTVMTSSGDVQGSFLTTSTGSVQVGTNSGDIDLALAESSERGYRLSAVTSSGDIEIGLKDGKSSSSNEGRQASFESDRYGQRAIRTEASFSSSSGDIDISVDRVTTPI